MAAATEKKLQKFAFSMVVATGLVCLPAAAQHGPILDDMHRDGAPCTDFFDYSNGAWRQSHAIPDYMDRWSRRWESGEVNKEHVKDILSELAQKKDWPAGSVEQLSGDFYAACMDERRTNELGLQPARKFLDEIASIRTRADLQRVIGHLHAVGIAAPFALSAAQDLHDPAQMVANVDAAGLGLPDRDYYLKSEERFVDARAKYLEHVRKMLILAGADPAPAGNDAKVVFEFEKRLAQASLDNVAQRDPEQLDHKLRYSDLVALAPDFDWGSYFDGAGLPRIDLNVAQPRFVEAFDKEMASAPLEDWRRYLTWQLLHSAANALPEPFVAENFAFYGKYLSGATEIKPRWKRCAEATDAQLGDAFGRVYVQKYFPPEAKAHVQEMVKNILLAMGDTIRGLDWMGAETKSRALEKLATFRTKIGYPDKWKDYRGVVIGRTSFWDDLMNSARWNVAYDLSQVGKPVDRARWDMTPPTSNAYYNASMNEIVFPAGILLPPAFDMNATDAMNYGAIGIVIGHEITHGFDDEGAKFDAEGRLRNWWKPADQRKFEEKSQCVVRQFDGYFIEPGIHHNGKLVLGESIADLGGAKLAFLAYRKSREGKGPEATIDGFTPEQQFFLSWGQWRGDETRPQTKRTMVQGDPHPIAQFRVNGPLSNLPAFREAFHCPAAAAMVRTGGDRCEVW